MAVIRLQILTPLTDTGVENLGIGDKCKRVSLWNLSLSLSQVMAVSLQEFSWTVESFKTEMWHHHSSFLTQIGKCLTWSRAENPASSVCPIFSQQHHLHPNLCQTYVPFGKESHIFSDW